MTAVHRDCSLRVVVAGQGFVAPGGGKRDADAKTASAEKQPPQS